MLGTSTEIMCLNLRYHFIMILNTFYCCIFAAIMRESLCNKAIVVVAIVAIVDILRPREFPEFLGILGSYPAPS